MNFGITSQILESLVESSTHPDSYNDKIVPAYWREGMARLA